MIAAMSTTGKLVICNR